MSSVPSSDQLKNTPCVLQVLPTLKTGGAEKTTVDVATALAKKGWPSFVASQGGRLTADIEASGAKHITVPLDTKNPLAIWKNAGRFEKLIKEKGINIIHARSRAPAWSAWLAAKRTGVAFVTTYHGAYNQKNWLKALYNSVMGRADAVIANSRWTEDLVKSRHPEAEGRITAIPRGTDFSQFKPSTMSRERLKRLRSQWGLSEHADETECLVLLLGRLTRLKGHRYLIDAASLTRNDLPHLKFIFAGDAHGRDDHVQELKDRIKGADLENRVLMPGHCDDPAAAMALADIVVSASVQAETFGRTIVEASALEKPVIVTDIGAVVESVLTPPQVSEDERTGWKVEPASGQALAEALRTAVSLSPDQRHQIGAKGRQFVTKHFSLEQMCEKTLEVYAKVLTR